MNMRVSTDWGGIGLIVFVLLTVALIVAASVQGEKSWQQFAAEHDCKVVAKIPGTAVPTFGVSGAGAMTSGVAVVPDKTGWLCNDGVTYYR